MGGDDPDAHRHAHRQARRDTIMRIAISATGSSLEAEVHPRFGRCPCFIIVDTDTMEFEAVENVHAGGSGGVGIAASRMMLDKGVQAVLTGNIGPNASQVFSAAGIPVTTGVAGKVGDAAAAHAAGGPEPAAASETDPRPISDEGLGLGMGRGTGQGMGRGMGRGGGRGMGRGRGAGRGMGRGMGRGGAGRGQPS